MFYSGFYFGIHIQDGSKSESTLSRHVHKVHLIVRENAGEETKWSKKTKLVSRNEKIFRVRYALESDHNDCNKLVNLKSPMIKIKTSS